MQLQPLPSISEMWNRLNVNWELDIYAVLTHGKCK